MATNLAINDKLILKAQELGNHRTKKAAVTEALELYINHKKQQQILELFGKVDMDKAYDYKKQRNKN